MPAVIPTGYRLRVGSGLERALLVQFMQRTYQEIELVDSYGHLAQTVEQYFSRETPLWWVDCLTTLGLAHPSATSAARSHHAVACLWMGTAIDQVYGDQHAHIFLLYVLPEHRRQGIGRALMHQAEVWARARGDRQIGLQVFESNQAALNLYQGLGFQTKSLWMVKPLT